MSKVSSSSVLPSIDESSSSSEPSALEPSTRSLAAPSSDGKNQNTTTVTTTTMVTTTTTTATTASASTNGMNIHQNQDTSSVYQDLMEFLQSPRQDLRLEATKAISQVVHDRNQVLQLLEHGALLPLLRVISDSSTSNETSCEHAMKVVLYLSSSVEQITNQCVEELLQAKAVSRLIEFVLSVTPTTSIKASLLNLGLAILANLTRTEQGAVELVGKTLPDYAVIIKAEDENTDYRNGEPTQPTMSLLLDRYLNREYVQDTMVPNYSELEPHQWDTLSHDPYQHFAAILMNATQLESGRNFVLKIPQTTPSSEETKKKNDDNKNAPAKPTVFEILLPQMNSTNPLRRRGISGMIRNCCLEHDAAWWMLNVVKITTPLLYPLAGPEELDWDDKQGMDPDLWLSGPDKERDIDEATRQHVVEALLLLCASGRQTRKTLRLARTYVILKYADMVEESETISERINECVQYLRRDEEGADEGSSDRMVEEYFAKTTTTSGDENHRLALPPSQIVGVNPDYDDVD